MENEKRNSTATKIKHIKYKEENEVKDVTCFVLSFLHILFLVLSLHLSTHFVTLLYIIR